MYSTMTFSDIDTAWPNVLSPWGKRAVVRLEGSEARYILARRLPHRLVHFRLAHHVRMTSLTFVTTFSRGFLWLERCCQAALEHVCWPSRVE